jgi:preprotein translocase subunit SecF
MEIINTEKIKIDFIGKAYFAGVISVLLIAISVYLWISQGEQKYGIDYRGGHNFVVAISDQANSEVIRSALRQQGLEGAIVQSFDLIGKEYSIRFAADERASSQVKESLLAALEEVYPSKIEVLQSDYVGPTIGAELRRAAVVAMIIGLIGILAYISFRFDFAFALGAVVALFHDVIISMGAYLLAGFTINVATMAAALTIVGYSVNDTIIVFDRMREEMSKRKEFRLKELMNLSIRATLSRTLITSLLTLFAALSLLILGGGAIADLALFLAVGVVVGTYSTIFIASPIALAWETYRAKES